ncbi:helix-turn-helix domain-containing protein [Vibrio cholerae]|uniref:YdaS family helix-turn-helix protein n=1 Tax=Vibrio cholerae TaxID=666 RepID=UPI0004E31951|nr:YdaS family helix-turn-helix protein [Vibrio cholerae]KFE10810.1 hypothetical protein DN36_183 [Vibrio cholerae]TXZ77511.1 helix-turn-helix domain-containing protein [Vibrio cholerae]GHZ87291.1 hypothetical protein VCSRO35_0185 [Vibrio cholerae]
MDELKVYLKSLKTSERHAFAKRVGTSLSYLRKVMSIQQTNLHPLTCALLEKESNGKVSRKSLRPDDWQLIWPELDLKERMRDAA